VQIIQSERLDIIVELGGYTSMSKLEYMMYKCAPIQLTYLGYFSTTGLECIDGWLADDEFNNYQIGKLIPIKGGHLAIDTSSFPSIEDTDEEIFWFGCYNNTRKITESTIRLFSSILSKCPRSGLRLKCSNYKDKGEVKRILSMLDKNKINKARLQILTWDDKNEDHLSKYNQIDISLDTYPYGGATTTADSLAMGVPVITLRGERNAGRLSSSILRNANLSKYIANTEEEYITKAINAYNEGKRAKQRRIQLREKINTSNFGNSKRLTQELEKIYCEYYKKIRQI